MKISKEKFGTSANWKWFNDPRQFFISLARYKFVARLLSGKKSVLEIGCSDGFNSRVVLQEVKNLTISDVDKKILKSARKIKNNKWKFKIIEHNFIKKKPSSSYLHTIIEGYKNCNIDLNYTNKF